MDQIFNKYDILIWRFNGILILLLAVVGLGVMIFSAFTMFQTNQKPAPDLINLNDKVKKTEHLRLGQPQKMEGTDLILIPLSSDDNPEGQSVVNLKSGGYYYSSNLRNYLLVNTKTKQNSWFWETNNNLILTDKKIGRGIAFEILEKDSNGDGSLDSKDQRTIQFFDFQNFSNTTIVSNIDREIGVELVNSDEVLFLYSENGRSFYKTFDLSKKVVSEAFEIGITQLNK